MPLHAAALTLAPVAALVLHGSAFAGALTPNEPLRAPNGDPVCAIYFFPHWWEPWKTSDEAVLRDLARLKAMGINTLLVDHEWSQAIDGNWGLLDRGHRLARQAGMQILPWLSLKTWSDMGCDPGRIRLAHEWFGVNLRQGVTQEGEPSSLLVYDDETIAAGAAYAEQYVRRYIEDGALARFRWRGQTRPCVALTVELGWDGASFDERTNRLFRDWLGRQYSNDVSRLNRAWGTSYTGFSAVDPRDTKVFDRGGHIAGRAAHPQAVEDHVEFCSQMVNRGLQTMKERLRDRFPSILIASELPYQVGSKHPHAVAYRIGYSSNPSTSYHADVLFLRMTGPMDAAEQEALADQIRRTGQKVVICYRTYSDWGRPVSEGGAEPGLVDALYGLEPARHAHGIGFYSWNEMVDVHLSAPGEGSPTNVMTVMPPVSDRMQAQAEQILRVYRGVYGR